jgi:EmrB/QacA subfamily drug resistance transporter
MSSQAAVALDAPPKIDRARWSALVVLCTGMLMVILDSTVVNVALPNIQSDLGFSQSSLAWVVDAYLITFGGLLLLAGRLGDLLGRRRIFLSGLVVFTVASVLCGIAQTQGELVGARLIQGVGGAMASSVILGMIVTMFPEPREQAKAIGVFAFVASAGGSIGLLAGGVLTQALNWHWIFLINVPIGIVTAIAARRLVVADKGSGGKADALGAVLVTAALMLGVYAIVTVTENGWASLHTLGLLGISAALLAGFIVRQDRAAEPLMPLRIFRSRNVSGANAVQVLMIAGFFGMFFLGSLYLQRVLGLDALEIGLAFLPVPVLIGGLSLGLAERLNTRFGPKRVLVAGLTSAAAGLFLFSLAPADGTYLPDVLPAFILLGLGAGLAFPAMVGLAMSGAHPSDAGLASGLVNTTQQVGGALGLSLLATLSTTRTSDALHDGLSQTAALTEGYQLAFTLAAALVVGAIVVAVTVLQSAPKVVVVHEEEAEPARELAFSEAA